MNTQNNLGRETSPYLLQHQDNPVHWQPWSTEVFARAKAEKKPVLLSVGYAACHWCHVMAHESFESDAVAGLMNELFVNIKVDREERPDIDAIYQQALALMGQKGGWPLTMFLTPEAEPFWGGTYFPPTSAYGRSGFSDVLQRVAEIYRQQPEAVEKNKTAILEALKKLSAPNTDADAVNLTSEVLDQVAGHLLGNIDMKYGGMTGAPKFPHTTALATIWRGYLRTGDAPLREAVQFSLRQMCQGGIYDHVGGGFSRYSTDERWLAPHFEKMLYDNALLVELMTQVWDQTRDPLLEVRIGETIGWLLREMRGAGGAFTSSLDADSEGVEGKFYVWQEAEIDELLGEAAEFFKSVYDVTGPGNWENSTILNRSGRLELQDAAAETRLALNRAILATARAKRIRPGWDDKILADWNGLAIAALALAGTVFDNATWIEAAVTAFDFISQTMRDGDRLLHSHRDGNSQHRAMLEDYSHMCLGALRLHQATGEARFVEQAEAWIAILDRHHWDDVNGGYYFTADDADDLIARQRTANDNAIPAGNGIAAEVLSRLWHLTGKNQYRERLDALFDAFSPALRENFFSLTTLLNSADLHINALQVVIVGNAGEDDTEALLRQARAAGNPNLILQHVVDGNALPELHPARGKHSLDGKAQAYVCIGTTCSLPLSDVESLAALLAKPDTISAG